MSTIGFLGLGSMGKAMVRRLIAAGHEVRVWNRSQGPVQDLVAEGAVAAATPADVAAPLIISMLADDTAVRSTILAQGLLDALPPGAIHVNMATISVALAEGLAAAHAQRGLAYVAAPVLGRPDAAAVGALHILVAGAAEPIDAVRPVLEVLGQKLWFFGEQAQQANAVKIAANFCIGAAIEAMGESAALAQAHGVAPAALIELLTGTIFAAPVYRNYGGQIAQQRYTPAGFKLRLGLKDVKLALEASDAQQVPMPFASVLRDQLLDALAHDEGELDWAALASVSLRRAGHES